MDLMDMWIWLDHNREASSIGSCSFNCATKHSFFPIWLLLPSYTIPIVSKRCDLYILLGKGCYQQNTIKNSLFSCGRLWYFHTVSFPTVLIWKLFCHPFIIGPQITKVATSMWQPHFFLKLITLSVSFHVR